MSEDAHDLVGDITRWLAEQRADAAAASRARERWLRQAAAEEALVAGVLLDLAERAATVVVQGVATRTHRGAVRAVGEDFVALRTGNGDVLLPFDAIGALRADATGSRGAPAGDRVPALDIAFAEAVAAVAGDRPRVLVVGRDGSGLSGELRSVGRDVATLRLADATYYVPLASVAELAIV